MKGNFVHFFSSRDIEEVHKIMDQVAEQRDLADELSDIISNPVNIGGEVLDEVSKCSIYFNGFFTAFTSQVCDIYIF